MNVLILTTATNRPDLHYRSFTSYKKFLNPELKIDWIINLDRVKGFGGDTGECENQIRDIFEDRDVNFKFITHRNGWFNRAVRKLVHHSIAYIDRADCVLYLEDDWEYGNSKGVTFLDTFDFDMDGNEHRILKKSFINLLSKRIQVQEVTLQPTIWSIRAFKDFMEVFNMSCDTSTCPELLLEAGLGPHPKIIRFQYPLFKDIGREWAKSKGLRKPPKGWVGGKDPNYKTYKYNEKGNLL